MKISLKFILGASALIGLAMPLWAHTDEMTLHLDKATLVGKTQLAAGDYQVKADESKKDLKVIKDGTVVADVPGHWVNLSTKPENDQSLIEGDRVSQFEFEGQLQSFVIG